MSFPLQILIDWDKNANFTGPYDDITAEVMTAQFNLGLGEAYETMLKDATLNVMLENIDGKYNPENSASPLFGKLKHNRLISVQFPDGTLLWRGYITHYAPEWAMGGDDYTGKTVARISANGLENALYDAQVTLALGQNVRADAVIQQVVSAVGTPPAVFGAWLLGIAGFSELGETNTLGDPAQQYALDEGVSTFRYFGDFSEAETGYDLVREAVDAERGQFYFSRNGVATFKNRLAKMRNTTVVATVDDTSSAPIKPIQVDYAYGEHLVNVAHVTAYPRKAESAVTLWQLDTPLTIPAGQTVTFMAPYTNVSQFDVGADGASVSISGESYSQGTASASLREFAHRAEVSVDNSGDEAAVLQTLVITGQPLETGNRIEVSYQDDDSIAQNARRVERSLNLRPIDSYDEAYGIAYHEVATRKAERGDVRSITVQSTADTLSFIKGVTIGDRITLTLKNGHSADHHIIGEQHQAGQNSHLVTYFLEPANAVTYWLLGEAGFGELDSTTLLGF